MVLWLGDPFENLRNHRNEGLEGSPIGESKSYKFKLKQNTCNTKKLLSIYFPYNYNTNEPKQGPKFPINFK